MFSKAILSVLVTPSEALNCHGVAPYDKQPGIDAYCNTNCSRGWCPETHCKCDEDDATTAPPNGNCRPTATYASQPGMDTWCNDVCPTGYCPETHCICDGSQPTTASPTTAPDTTSSPTTTVAPDTTTAPTTTASPTTTESQTTTSAPVTTEQDESTTEQDDDSVIDSTVRLAQASMFGNYFDIAWNQVRCAMDESDAKPYMQTTHPHCATAINMGMGQFATTDQNGGPGFCVRTSPGNGAPKASSCWKVRCVGDDNQLNVGISCRTHEWIYLKTVDTNTENSLSLTDDQYTQQCAPVAMQTNTPSCRAFDITIQAYELLAVFASNQGDMAGKPANTGVIPLEYQEVNCEDSVVKAAISSSGCGLQNNLLI